MISVVLLGTGCAVLTSNPYYKPSITESAEGKRDAGGFAYLRFGGQNMLMTTEREVNVGVKSLGSMHGYVPMAMGPILPIIPTFLTAPDRAHPIVHMDVYLYSDKTNYTFDPMAVRIVNSNGIEYKPISYAGPETSGMGAFSFYGLTGKYNDTRDIALPKNYRSCFVLQFDLGSMPDWNLTMYVNGIKINGDIASPPAFKFERGTALYVMWGGREYFCSG
jgi:hypothetical protein